jgi:hypothetical protein
MERITLERGMWRLRTYVLAAVADPLGLDHPGERALVGLLDLHLCISIMSPTENDQ